MADLRTVLIGLTLLAYASAASYLEYPGIYPIVFFDDFRYEPTDAGYVLWYKTETGVTHRELGYARDARGNDGDDSNPDTLGSSNEGRHKSKIPLKNRKVSPKLLASLSG